jgi:hypothetical protein
MDHAHCATEWLLKSLRQQTTVAYRGVTSRCFDAWTLPGWQPKSKSLRRLQGIPTYNVFGLNILSEADSLVPSRVGARFFAGSQAHQAMLSDPGTAMSPCPCRCAS